MAYFWNKVSDQKRLSSFLWWAQRLSHAYSLNGYVDFGDLKIASVIEKQPARSRARFKISMFLVSSNSDTASHKTL
jgi:hypothetical protein